MKKVTSSLVLPQFFKKAAELRKAFESRFSNPKATGEVASDRFVWDFWHVPNQYRLLRTPAEAVFPEKLIDEFQNSLQKWGWENLGCGELSPLWLSCYVDGCEQKLHIDKPHGPWAFVYSLTDWKNRSFEGGETFLARDELLEFWKNFSKAKSMESLDAFQKVPPLFNQLLVFDGRIPHGVEKVSNARDVLEGRLVIHGWFRWPEPRIFAGPIRMPELQSQVQRLIPELESLTETLPPIFGMASFLLDVSADGQVRHLELLGQNLRSEGDVDKFLDTLAVLIHRICRFKKQKTGSKIQLPLVFD